MKKTSKKGVTIISTSEAETIAFGRRLAHFLKPRMILALEGTLGSGKTTLTKGIVDGLFRTKKIKVTSPSFALVNQYDGSFPVFHIDCYRLNEIKDYEEIGIDEFLFSSGIAIIEWSEKIKTLLPKRSIFIKLSHNGENRRKFLIKSNDVKFISLLRRRLNV